MIGDYMKEALYQEEYRQLISTDALLSRHTAVPRYRSSSIYDIRT
jgi:hypothetical protein